MHPLEIAESQRRGLKRMGDRALTRLKSFFFFFFFFLSTLYMPPARPTRSRLPGRAPRTPRRWSRPFRWRRGSSRCPAIPRRSSWPLASAWSSFFFLFIFSFFFSFFFSGFFFSPPYSSIHELKRTRGSDRQAAAARGPGTFLRGDARKTCAAQGHGIKVAGRASEIQAGQRIFKEQRQVDQSRDRGAPDVRDPRPASPPPTAFPLAILFFLLLPLFGSHVR
jgi:hypothetical protein